MDGLDRGGIELLGTEPGDIHTRPPMDDGTLGRPEICNPTRGVQSDGVPYSPRVVRGQAAA
jgi:hypothetical protein